MPSSACQTSALDRKSTRLNSSHTLISYAVFCLKKKETGSTVRHSTGGERLEPGATSGAVDSPTSHHSWFCCATAPCSLRFFCSFFFFLKNAPPPKSPPFPPPAPFPT